MTKHNSSGRFIFWRVILEFWFCILDLGVWIWRFGQKTIMKKRKKKYIAYGGLILFYHRERLSWFFLCFGTWWEIRWTCTFHGLGFIFSMVWVAGAGLSYIFEVLIPYRQENVHCKVAGFIFLWFLNGLGVWGRVTLHFWTSNPLQAGKCTLQGCGFHFPVISQWFGCLGQGQATFLKV